MSSNQSNKSDKSSDVIKPIKPIRCHLQISIYSAAATYMKPISIFNFMTFKAILPLILDVINIQSISAYRQCGSSTSLMFLFLTGAPLNCISQISIMLALCLFLTGAPLKLNKFFFPLHWNCLILTGAPHKLVKSFSIVFGLYFFIFNWSPPKFSKSL